jgi:putative ABC transport system substrate-binding protein
MDWILLLALFFLLLINSFGMASGLANKLYRIGILSNTGPDLRAVRGVRNGLHDLGYREGENLVLQISPKSSYDKLRALAATFRESRVDVIVTIGTVETAIAKQIAGNIPIVFAPASNPLDAGFINSFSRPGTNLTGIAYDLGPEKHTKELELFKEALPGLTRVAILYDATNSTRSRISTHLRRTARHLRLALSEFAVGSIDDVTQVASSFSPRLVHGVLIVCGNLFGGDQETPRILRKRKIPLFGCPSQVLNHGALMSYGPNGYLMGRRAAWYIDRILKGEPPQFLPVGNPAHFELIVNLKTADNLAIKISPDVLQRADKVIK